MGDNLLATGLARGAHKRGKRIAFGDGKTIIWDHQSEQIFQGNPNIAPLGSEGADDLQWINFYRGNRLYNTQRAGRWEWNYDFRPTPGEIFFTDQELKWAERFGRDFIIVESNVPEHKTVARNKQWPILRYEKLARYLHKGGHDIRQFVYFNARHKVVVAKPIKPPNFRHALAVLARAKLYIGPEGGLHHGAAAVGTKAVVIFGGFIPPQVTGYDMHVNIAAEGKACGVYTRCAHCAEAMESISVEQVHRAAMSQLVRAAA